MNETTTTAPGQEPAQEFQAVIGEIKDRWADLKPVPGTIKTLQEDTAELQQQVKDVRRLVAARCIPGSPFVFAERLRCRSGRSACLPR